MTVHHVAVLALDGVTPLDLAIPAQIFTARPETPYEMTLCALGAKVATTAGFALLAAGGLEQVRTADTVIVPGFEPILPLPDAALDALAQARDRGKRVVSICTGAFALAQAGVLDGLHATTHWKHIDEFERDFPAVTVERDVLYVDQGDVLTSAGVCCGIDLCLHIVRRDLGADAANQIARGLVAAPHRDGGQAQYVPAPVAVAARHRSPASADGPCNGSASRSRCACSPGTRASRSAPSCAGSPRRRAPPRCSGCSTPDSAEHGKCWKPRTARWIRSRGTAGWAPQPTCDCTSGAHWTPPPPPTAAPSHT